MQVSLPYRATRLLPFGVKSAVSRSLDLFFEVVGAAEGAPPVCCPEGAGLALASRS